MRRAFSHILLPNFYASASDFYDVTTLNDKKISYLVILVNFGFVVGVEIILKRFV